MVLPLVLPFWFHTQFTIQLRRWFLMSWPSSTGQQSHCVYSHPSTPPSLQTCEKSSLSEVTELGAPLTEQGQGQWGLRAAWVWSSLSSPPHPMVCKVLPRTKLTYERATGSHINKAKQNRGSAEKYTGCSKKRQTFTCKDRKRKEIRTATQRPALRP